MAKTERIEARLSAEQGELVRWAASVRGVGVSTFLVQSAVERARQMQRQEQLTVLPREREEAFRAWLEEAAQPPDEMGRLADAEPFEHR